MNEEDLMIQKKIEKREKTDIMIAYVMIVVLVICILLVVYLKFIRKNDNNNNGNTTEYTVNYISLGTITSDINNNLSSKYSGINANTGENSINVNYGNILFDVKLINNELEFNMDNDNKELSEDIYKEIVTSICSYYSNDRDGCKKGADAITFGNNDTGIRFVNNTMYISTTNGISPISNIDNVIYTEETIADIDNFDYEINMNDKVISDINVDMSDVDITISGDLSSSGNVNVKIYDNDEKLLEEKSTDGENNFSISFEYNDNLNIDSIKKYSISIE